MCTFVYTVSGLHRAQCLTPDNGELPIILDSQSLFHADKTARSGFMYNPVDILQYILDSIPENGIVIKPVGRWRRSGW